MFSVNEKVVYPGHGVALINRKVHRMVAGKNTYFFELKFYTKEMTVLVPENRLGLVGIRPVSSLEDIKKIISLLDCGEACQSEIANWNKRNKEYQCKLRSGDIFQMCSMYKELQFVRQHKELSFGERGLLSQIEDLLAEEVGIVLQLPLDESRDFLRKPFNKYFSTSATGAQVFNQA